MLSDFRLGKRVQSAGCGSAHGKGFYDLLSRIMPDWEYRREKVEGFENSAK
ncbi:MAG: M48 family metallopeptidase [Anaerolineae bacterium]|nr:M48 family metallopeptidase [Anaerolineae bacterium]